MIIYKVTNVDNHKIYIGKTQRSLSVRKREHERYTKNSKSYFHKALRHYGSAYFLWEVLCTCISIEELNIKEQEYINFYNSVDTDVGYNIAKGGEGGDTFTNDVNKEVRREKMRINSTGTTNPFYGKTHTNEAKNLISMNTIEHRSGKQHSIETKQKMSVSARGEYNSQVRLTIQQVKSIKKLLSIKELSQTAIAKLYNVSRSTILKINLGTMWGYV